MVATAGKVIVGALTAPVKLLPTPKLVNDKLPPPLKVVPLITPEPEFNVRPKPALLIPPPKVILLFVAVNVDVPPKVIAPPPLL